jgi:hypothetical protein
MQEIEVTQLIKKAEAGDVLLTANPEGLGTVIKWFQELRGDPAVYTHAALIAKLSLYHYIGDKYYVLDANKTVYYNGDKYYVLDANKTVDYNGDKYYVLEANKTLDYKPINQYFGKRICLLRNKNMTVEKYAKGFRELFNNLGQKYPYYRLLLQGIDNLCNRLLRVFHVKPLIHVAKLIKFDHPVCSEWVAQFFIEGEVPLEQSAKKGEKISWGGVDPDDFDDWRQKYPEIWETIFEGILTDDKEKKDSK